MPARDLVRIVIAHVREVPRSGLRKGMRMVVRMGPRGNVSFDVTL